MKEPKTLPGRKRESLSFSFYNHHLFYLILGRIYVYIGYKYYFKLHIFIFYSSHNTLDPFAEYYPLNDYFNYHLKVLWVDF